MPHYYDLAPLSPARRELYTYKSEQPLALGAIVVAPFGNRQEEAVVWAAAEPLSKARQITQHTGYLLPERQRDLAGWIAEQYASPLGVVLKGFLPASLKETAVEEPPKPLITKASRPLVDLRRLEDRRQAFAAKAQEQAAEGRSTLWLMPETSGVEALRDEGLVFHSRLPAKARTEIWQRVYRGETLTIIGTRSTLLLPWQNLGLIILDEEDDLAYKQEQAPRWLARSVAAQLAQTCGTELIYGSVSPSLEVWRGVAQGNFAEMVGPSPEAEIAFVTPAAEGLSYQAQEGLRQAAYAAVYAPAREHARLHRQLAVLARPLFHYQPDRDGWPETQRRLAAWRQGGLLHGGYPLARGGTGPAPLVVATGIDSLLQLPDFRAAEKAHGTVRRLLALVAPGGKLLIETATPEHPALSGLGQPFAQWAAQELAERQALQLPPFVRLSRLIFAAADEQTAQREAAAAQRKLEKSGLDIAISPTPVPPRQGAQWHAIIKGDPRRLKPFLDPAWTVDVDPLTVF